MKLEHGKNTSRNEKPVVTPSNNEPTIRDVFACAALQGMLADHTACATAEKYALAAYKMADAMLAARKGGDE